MLLGTAGGWAQINTDQVMRIGRNSLYYEDYILSIQYFNQVIKAKPFLADPYYYRSIAKIYLEDYNGAEEDATQAIERNPFIVGAYQLRAVARQNIRDFQGAYDDYEKSLSLNPHDNSYQFNRAACLFELKRYHEADSMFRALLVTEPKNERIYLGLAQLYLEQKDSVQALEWIDKSIEMSTKNGNAYLIKADILMRGEKKDYEGALKALDSAIELDPRNTGLLINRAFIRYKLDDYVGAKEDFDYVIKIDPDSYEAHYNRAMLMAEVGEKNKAIEDFGFILKVKPNNVLARYNRASLYTELGNIKGAIGDYSAVLQQEPGNFVARYTRAIMYFQTGQYRNAIADFDVILKKYPQYESGYMARAEAKKRIGDNAGCEADYKRAIAVFNKKGVHMSTFNPMTIEVSKMRKTMEKKQAELQAEEAREAKKRNEAAEAEETAEDVINKFNTMLTVAPENPIKPEYANRQRGRIQNNNYDIEPEPMFMLSYYAQDNQLNGNTYYVKEIAEINDTRLLPGQLSMVAGEEPLDEETIDYHFGSIEYYDGLMASSRPRAIDYLGRGLDHMLVRNIDAAINDAKSAVELNENFAMAHFLLSNAYYVKYMMLIKGAEDDDEKGGDAKADAMLRQQETANLLKEVQTSLDNVLKYSPKNVYAIYNKGNVYILLNDYTQAIDCFTKAIEYKPDFAAAYYNRGLMYLRTGNRERGVADLSKAGELGVLPSYNVLKRMNN